MGELVIKQQEYSQRLNLLLTVCALLWAAVAWSQHYPSKPIRLIVPFAPGGGTDIVARTIGQRLNATFSQPVIVDNRPGGGTTIGTGIAAASSPDGHTLVMVASTFAADATLYPNLPYSPGKSFSPISRVTTFPFVLVATPSLPAKSLSELISFAKANPGKLNYASGSGSAPAHLGMELLKWLAGVNIVGIPFKGAGPGVTAILSSEVDLLFSTIPAVLPHLKSGRLRGLAVTTASRYPVVPELPTIAEAGVPGYEFISWHGVLAPAGTPQTVIARLNGEINKVMRSPEAQERLARLGLDADGNTPLEFANLINAEVKRWAKVIKDAGISAN